MKTKKIMGKIVSLDPIFDTLIDANTQIEILAEGFAWTEGPVWIKDGEFLLFSDIPNNVIYKWKEGQGISEFLKPSGYTGLGYHSKESGSNGLALSSDGGLIVCEHGDRRVTKISFKNGEKETLADRFDGKKFNSPNDVVEKSNGDIYFTDPIYGLPNGEFDETREINFCGVYKIDKKTREVVCVVSNLLRPNGLAFSPKEDVLYVSQSHKEFAYIMGYPVLKNGSLGGGAIFYDTTPFLKQGFVGLPDGLKLDINGNLFATGPSGILVISPKRDLLGRIETGQLTSNCAWGGSALYITANSFLLRIQTNGIIYKNN